MKQTTTKLLRYRRQTALKEFGFEGQEKLIRSKVLVVGAGGLGCPALQYLSAAGVGTIGIIDFDKVELTNLHRQPLFGMDDIGKFKAEVASIKLSSLNPEIKFDVYKIKLSSANALELINAFDVVIDGTDNFSSRYMINDACVLLNKPLVYGAVLGFEGQVGVFNLVDKNNGIAANYRDLYPQPPQPNSVPSCNENGVLGVLPGIIGTMQAAEAIKIITGIGSPLRNIIVSYNVLNNFYYEITISPLKSKRIKFPKTKSEFNNYDYEWFCGEVYKHHEITLEEFDILRKNDDINIIDVREIEELTDSTEFSCIKIPLSRFKESLSKLNTNNTIVVICQTGKRSLTAVKLIKDEFPECKAYSLQGGISEWKKHNQNNLV